MIIGQTMGIIAVILGFVSFQMRTRKQLMIVQIATAITFCVHYGLIGATSGMMMNILSTLRNLCYYYKDKKIYGAGETAYIDFAPGDAHCI